MFNVITRTFSNLAIIGLVVTAFVTIPLGIPMMIFLGLIGLCSLLLVGGDVYSMFKSDKKDEKKTEAKKDTAAEGKTPEVNVDQHKPQPQPQPEAAPAV